MVTFAPIFQRGCANACLGVTLSSSCSVALRKGPPEAVRSKLAGGVGSPTKH